MQSEYLFSGIIALLPHTLDRLRLKSGLQMPMEGYS
jgi:hypothetical protein